MAINSTFSRTIITSVTTIVMLIPLFIFGGGSIKGFAFAIMIGIIVGTYSSIFVATPIVRDLSKDLSMKKATKSVGKKSFSAAAESAK
jgi:SecD/SecF fusion protein